MKLLILLLITAQLWGAGAIVGTPGSTVADSVSSQSVTIASTTASNHLIADVYHPSSISVSSIACSGCTWQLACASSSGNSRSEIWYAESIPASVTSVTVTMSGSERWIARVSQVSGLATGAPVCTASTGAFGLTASASVTATGSASFVMATAGWNWSSTAGAPTNSFTVLGTNINNGTVQRSLVGAYKASVAAGAQSTAWTISGDVDWGAAAASFTESGGAPPAGKRKVVVVN